MNARGLPELEALDALPAEAAAGWIAAAQTRLAARLLAAASEPRAPVDGDRLMPIEEAAERTAMSRDWLYRHGRKVGIARKVGGALRFSEQAINRWIASRRG